jgi:acetylornithine deacetylase/succinyl-diaminopimelate desuccinylase-like protein
VVDASEETTGILQALIRNACVNDGSPDSGGERRNATLLEDYLAPTGADIQLFEPRPGRTSLVARLEGTHPGARRVALLSHLDVVPATPRGWRYPPFKATLADGFVWGRGATDMLSQTAAMAVAMRRLASRRPFRGTLLLVATADEEAMGVFGADWLVKQHGAEVAADYVLTEIGGFRLPLPWTESTILPVMVGERGVYWTRITARGTPGHAAFPVHRDTAMTIAGEAILRVAKFRPQSEIHNVWTEFVSRCQLPEEVAARLLDAGTVEGSLDSIPDITLRSNLQALMHATFTPTMVRGGIKTNVIPDEVTVDVDGRSLPGQSRAYMRRTLARALGDLASKVEINVTRHDVATVSPSHSPLWDAVEAALKEQVPEAVVVPLLVPGTTDARFFRRAGAIAYGASVFSSRLSYADFSGMFHGVNERIDQVSLGMLVQFYERVASELVAS